MNSVEVEPAFFEEMVYDGVMLLIIGQAVLKLSDGERTEYVLDSVHNPIHAAYESMLSNGYKPSSFGLSEIKLCHELEKKIRQIVPDIDDPSTNDPPKEVIAQRIADEARQNKQAA